MPREVPMDFCRQLKALVKKNLILKKRSCKSTLWNEVAMPFIFGLFISLFCSRSESKT